MQIFKLIPLIKLQNTTVQFNNEKRDGKLNHFVFGWATLFSCPVKAKLNNFQPLFKFCFVA